MFQILPESDDPRYRLGLARTSAILAAMLGKAGMADQARSAAEDAARIYAELDLAMVSDAPAGAP